MGRQGQSEGDMGHPTHFKMVCTDKLPQFRDEIGGKTTGSQFTHRLRLYCQCLNPLVLCECV